MQKSSKCVALAAVLVYFAAERSSWRSCWETQLWLVQNKYISHHLISKSQLARQAGLLSKLQLIIMASTLAQASDAVAVKPRPIIHRMVLENFKSYGGAHTVGPFHKRFSSIVGPNGSGKSNVIDAMLFVFGERAKKLRLRKVSELIHKSSGLPDLEQATVSVHFVDIVDTGDGDEDYEVIKGSEIVVSRTAYRNNSSKYCVNGKTSTFTEVTTMLREKGIDLDNNRFLILQGEVEQISLMKPKAQNPHDTGMLEYLEDIIGSNKYVEPIDEAEKVLEERNERRSEQANRVKAAEKERDGLESGKLEAEEYLRKEAEIKQRQSVLYQCKLHEAVQAIEQLTVKETQLIEKQDYEKQKLKDVVSEAEEVKTAYDRTTKEYEAVHAEMEKARADFTSFERKDIKYREDIKHTKQQLKKQQKAIEKEQAKVVAASEQLTSCEEALPELQAAIGDREAEKATADAKLDKILDSLKVSTVSRPLLIPMAMLASANHSRHCFIHRLMSCRVLVSCSFRHMR